MPFLLLDISIASFLISYHKKDSYSLCLLNYTNISDVLSFRDELREMGHSTYYIYIYISALKSLYRFLRINQLRLNLEEAYDYDIMIPIKNEKIKKHLKKPMLTLEEANRLLVYTKANRNIIYDYRNYAIICLMITAGLSSYEIIHLKREDYQVLNERGVLQIRKRNSMNVDIVHLSKGVTEAIEDYLKRRKKLIRISLSHKIIRQKKDIFRECFFIMFFEESLRNVG